MYKHTSLLAQVQRDLLGGDPVFPTSMRLAVTIRQMLDKDDVSVSHVARLVSVEPFMAAKIVRMANSVAFNPNGQTVFSVEQALSRIGFNVLRSVALSVAVAQLRATPSMAVFPRLSNASWESSVQLAALARLLAKHKKMANPDEAMMCGLMSEMGTFYLLYLASSNPAYVKNIAAVLDLLHKHGERVGAQFVQALGLPENIVKALTPGELESNAAAQPLRNTLQEARRLLALPTPVPQDEPQAEWLDSVREQLRELQSVLRG